MNATRIEFRIYDFVVQQCTTSHNVVISEIDNDAPNALKHIAHVEYHKELTREGAEKLLERFFSEMTTI